MKVISAKTNQSLANKIKLNQIELIKAIKKNARHRTRFTMTRPIFDLFDAKFIPFLFIFMISIYKSKAYRV